MPSLPRPAMRVFRALPESVRQRAVRAITPTYTLGAQARITREDGRILLVKAAYRWRWGMPGGLMEVGESPDDAVRRETLEETGLAITTLGEPLVLVETVMQRVNFIYDAVPADGVDPDGVRPQASEILEIGWFDPDDLPETIPDMSGEVFLRERHSHEGAHLIVTGELPADTPPTSASS